MSSQGFDLFVLFSLLTGCAIVLDLVVQLWLVASTALHNNLVAARVVTATTLRSRNRRSAARFGGHAVLSAAKVVALAIYVALWWSTMNKVIRQLESVLEEGGGSVCVGMELVSDAV
jgi:hypothetical protein